MLKCFTLENALQGLCLLLKKTLKNRCSLNSSLSIEEMFVVTTTVIDKQSGEFINEVNGMFDFSDLSNPNATVLF